MPLCLNLNVFRSQTFVHSLTIRIMPERICGNGSVRDCETKCVFVLHRHLQCFSHPQRNVGLFKTKLLIGCLGECEWIPGAAWGTLEEQWTQFMLHFSAQKSHTQVLRALCINTGAFSFSCWKHSPSGSTFKSRDFFSTSRAAMRNECLTTQT